MQNGQRKDVLSVDGLKIGMIIKLLFATGASFVYWICVPTLLCFGWLI